MVIFAQPTIGTLLIGIAMVLGGEFLRLWSVAIAGSETRTTGPVGGTYLITTGPFAYVRNPLYLGNIIIYTGVGVMANALTPWLAIGALIYFVFQYSLIVSLEEGYLASTFGDEFQRYCVAVPRFVPGWRRYVPGENPQPELDWKEGMRSESRTLQAIVLVTTVLIVFWAVG